ncbi:hypothetical protein [Roseomonas chloroacetimidivorans]|uniref:hypothetical protein n=1 Tax=Roseomonas chloroacetimidivorans TaxID=1766656 RepID=UPI003C78B07B
MTSTEMGPTTCTLASCAYEARVAWIRELTTRSFRDHRRDGLELHLTYEAEAVQRVRELIQHERACCGFLGFDLRQDADGVRLTITAPKEAREAADQLFAQFVPLVSDTRASCGCGCQPEGASR